MTGTDISRPNRSGCCHSLHTLLSPRRVGLTKWFKFFPLSLRSMNSTIRDAGLIVDVGLVLHMVKVDGWFNCEVDGAIGYSSFTEIENGHRQHLCLGLIWTYGNTGPPTTVQILQIRQQLLHLWLDRFIGVLVVNPFFLPDPPLPASCFPFSS